MSLNKILINDTTTVNTGIVYDISKAHNGATYNDLTGALGTNGSNVPLEVREGGMSVKFIQTSDNKYVQYRLMSTSFSTNKADWQSVMSAADKDLLDYYNRSRGNYIELQGSYGELEYRDAKVKLGNRYFGPLNDMELDEVILKAATTEHAGVMSAADKKILDYYNDSRGNYLEVYSSGFNYYADKVEIGNLYSDSLDDLLMVTIPLKAATTDQAGVMSAADKKILDYYNDSRGNYLEVYSSGFNYYADKVEIGNLYSDSLDDLLMVTIPLKAATTDQAGVMSAADKTRLDLLKEQLIDNGKVDTLPADILSETSIVYEETKVTLEFEQNHCGSSDGYQPVTKERTISAATSTHAGVMSAADKTKLDEIVSLKGDIPPLSEEELDEILADDGPSVSPPMGDFEE